MYVLTLTQELDDLQLLSYLKCILGESDVLNYSFCLDILSDQNHKCLDKHPENIQCPTVISNTGFITVHYELVCQVACTRIF